MDPHPLPIDAARAAFETALAAAAPVVVAAPTGSGKSTRLPLWARPPVLVVEPRRVACRALATWLAAGCGEPVGASIGYRVRFDERAGPDTRVVFVTPGVALNLIADGAVDRFATVIVDEFHERSWEVDLVVALLRSAADRRGLVLCSATLDVERLTQVLDARRVTAEGRAFEVTFEHRGDGAPTARDLAPRVADAVSAALAQREGDVLVFLPGKGEIERCSAAIVAPAAEIVPVHGGISPEVLTRAFAARGGRRVYLATNVAETSLTLPGVETVIDSGLVRMRIHQAGRAVLALVATSQASMDQRAGRAGRVAPGHCVRLWARGFAPAPVTAPELERIDLDDLVLRASLCGLDGDALESAPWVTPPPAFALESARARLRERGTLDAAGRATPLGRAQARLPVSWQGARILADAPGDLTGDLCDVVALVEVHRDLLLPGARFDDARNALFEGARDELSVQIRALRGGVAAQHGLHRGALDEARRLSRSLRRICGAAARPDHQRLAPEVVPHLLARVPEAAFVPRAGRRGRRARSDSRPWANGDCELAVREFVVPGLSSSEQPPPAEAGIVLDNEWLGVGRGARGVGRLLLRCSKAQLRAAGLGQVVTLDPRVEKDGSIVAEVEQRYAGVVLHRDREPLRGAELCTAAAELILAGRLRRGLGDVVRDDLHAWALIAASAREGAVVPAAPEPGPYIAGRLRSHGVERADDLRLLEDADLRPDVAALGRAAALTDREVEALSQDFPRVWAYPGGRCRCRVDFSRRVVVLEPESRHAKGDPPARFLPRFRGFQVEYRKASRRIRLR